MSEISAADVKKLRDRTNSPFKDCKAALVEANGDLDKAVEILRERNAALRDKKGEREAAEGRVGIYIDEDKQVGGIIEMRCETAPSAKNELFVQLTDDFAKQVALQGADSVEALCGQTFVDDGSKTLNDRITEVVGLIRENMKPARCAQLKGLLGSYVHHDGTVGVLLKVEGDKISDPQVVRDVCMHIAATAPLAATRDDMDPELVKKEEEMAKKQAEGTGKPANIVERIVEGKMKSWYAENVLVDQPFVKDDKQTVEQYLKSSGLKVVTFVRYKIGELS